MPYFRENDNQPCGFTDPHPQRLFLAALARHERSADLACLKQFRAETPQFDGKIMADHPVPPFSTAIQASPSRPWFLDGSDAHWNLEDLASTSQRSPNSDVFWIANRFEQFYEKDAIDIYGYLWILWISMDPGTGM